jgi:hypothetical protein
MVVGLGVSGSRGEGIGKEKFGEFALAEGDDVLEDVSTKVSRRRK